MSENIIQNQETIIKLLCIIIKQLTNKTPGIILPAVDGYREEIPDLSTIQLHGDELLSSCRH